MGEVEDRFSVPSRPEAQKGFSTKRPALNIEEEQLR
jgi:hypothetical protein